MGRQVVGLGPDNLSDLPTDCRRCAFWELSPAQGARMAAGERAELDKQTWLSTTTTEWGTCGQVAHVDGRPAGFALYAPPDYVPRATSFPTAPLSADAVLLMTLRVLPEARGHGVGRVLVQAVARDLLRRGYRAMEAFGRTTLLGSAAPTGATGCLVPVGYLTAAGFVVVRAHPVVPRLRLDLRSTVTWRASLEATIDRLRVPVPVAMPGS